jgi:hypothetical protein
MSSPVTVGGHTLASVLREGAARLSLTRPAIAAAVHVSPRTVSRWTNGQLMPHPVNHAPLLALYAPAGEAIVSRLRTALGLMPAPQRSASARKQDIDGALYAAAESLDCSPRAVRAAFAELLGRLIAMNVPLEDARRLVALSPVTPDESAMTGTKPPG